MRVLIDELKWSDNSLNLPRRVIVNNVYDEKQAVNALELFYGQVPAGYGAILKPYYGKPDQYTDEQTI
jgi:hypothetical protein